MLVLYHYFFIIILFTGGFAVFIKGQWKFANFFSSYFVIPLFSGYTYLANFFKTKYVKPSEVKLKPLFYDINRPEPPQRNKGWEKISLLWDSIYIYIYMYVNKYLVI